MNELEKKVEKMADEELGTVAGGVTANYLAALDVMAGKYGNGEERRARLTAAGIAGKYGNNQARINALTAAGYDAKLVQDLVNAILL